MLYYLWLVIQDLFLAASFAAMMRAVLNRLYGGRGRRYHTAGVLTGVASAAVLAIVKNTTNKIVSSRWNHYIYIVIVVLTLAFTVFVLLFGRKEKEKHASWTEHAVSVTGSMLIAVWIFYSLPAVMAYPFNFNTMGNGYWSWYYAERMIGLLIALLVLVIYAHTLNKCALQIKKYPLALWALLISVLVNALYCVGRYFIPWVNRAKWLNWPIAYTPSQHAWAKNWMMFTANHAMLFLYITAGAAFILCFLFFLENLHVTDPYDNSAQRRKLLARNRRHRRQAAVMLFFLAVSVLSVSVVKAYDTQVVELSAPETYTVSDGQILISMESVNDGNLHRFEYTTEKGVKVRWIVIKKPGSATYGVGLDACEVCGDAGYFQRGEQVVCKRCDVVMNINTIGFKGGCNPIPLPYSVSGGSLVFEISDIEAGEKEFR